MWEDVLVGVLGFMLVWAALAMLCRWEERKR